MMNKRRALEIILSLDVPDAAKARFRAALVGINEEDLVCLLGGEDKAQIVATMRAYLLMRRAAAGKGPRKPGAGPGNKNGHKGPGRKLRGEQGAGPSGDGKGKGPAGVGKLAII